MLYLHCEFASAFYSFASFVSSIDATVPDQSLGRLVNHDRNGNCVMKKVMVDKEPFLCLFAATDVSGGTELRYDYGVSNLPWEVKVYSLNLSKHSRYFKESTFLPMFWCE